MWHFLQDTTGNQKWASQLPPAPHSCFPFEQPIVMPAHVSRPIKRKVNKWNDYVQYLWLENVTLSHKGRVTNERIPKFVLWCFTYVLEGEKAPLAAVELQNPISTPVNHQNLSKVLTELRFTRLLAVGLCSYGQLDECCDRERKRAVWPSWEWGEMRVFRLKHLVGSYKQNNGSPISFDLFSLALIEIYVLTRLSY